MKTIVEYLKQMDLSETEARLYLALIEGGPKRVKDLAELVGLKRTTAYFHIDSLLEKGLVAEVMKGSHKQISVTSPERLKYLVERKLSTAVFLKKSFPDILKTIGAIQPKIRDSEEPEIKYFKGINSVRAIYYDDALKAKELRLYATLSELAPLFPDDPDLFDNALKRNLNLKIYEIYGDQPDIIKNFSYTAKSDRYFYKFMPSHVGLVAPGILLYDNKVAIINVQEKISGVVLHNKDYYVNSKKLFDFMWKMLPEPSL